MTNQPMTHRGQKFQRTSVTTWCRHCGKLIEGQCPQCGDKLFPYPDDPNLAICRNGPTTLLFSREATEPFEWRACENCIARGRHLSDEDRANIAALDGAGNRG